jgi:cytochrome c553
MNKLWFALFVCLFLCVAAFADDASNATQLERGKYLVTLMVCDDCHTPKVMSDQGPVPDETRRLSGHPHDEKVPPIPAEVGPGKWGAAGSQSFTAWAGPWGISFAANLTPDVKTGLGSWTPEMFISTLRNGKHMGTGRAILPPMPWPNFRNATDDDLKAIFAYLHSLKPVSNAVPDPVPPPAPVPAH